jgi:hypothetical protein
MRGGLLATRHTEEDNWPTGILDGGQTKDTRTANAV